MFYHEDHIRETIFLIVAILTILIACLGLFGLATYMAEQRIKEIGIRKVLGASIISIIAMFSKDFLKLVVVSCLVAFPLAWWVMHSWLTNFAYRIGIGWETFVFSICASLLIAAFTISYKTITAALTNPIKSLRTE